jgi:hypothetical protein
MMAKMIEEVIVIKLSKLVKDSDQLDTIADSDAQAALEQVAQELAGSGVLVEVEKSNESGQLLQYY